MIAAKTYVGAIEVLRRYIGDTLVWQKEPNIRYNWRMAVNLSSGAGVEDTVPGNWNNIKASTLASGTVFNNLIGMDGAALPNTLTVASAGWGMEAGVPIDLAPDFPAPEAYTQRWFGTSTTGILRFGGLNNTKRYSVQVLCSDPAQAAGAIINACIVHNGVNNVRTNTVAMVRDVSLPTPADYDFGGWLSFDNLTSLQAGDMSISFTRMITSVKWFVQAVVLTEYEADPQHVAVPTGSSDAPLPHYRYLPTGYDGSEDAYPLVIFMHGNGEAGNGTSTLTNVEKYGIPRQLMFGSFPRNDMMVFSPQRPTTGGWIDYLTQLTDFVAWVKANYRVDSTRVYMVGFSGGGYGILDYISANPETHGIAAAVLAASRNLDGADLSIVKDVPMWLFAKNADSVVPFADTLALRNNINALSPAVPCRLTAWRGSTHDAINATCDGTGIGAEMPEYDSFTQNIYDWLMSYSIA